MGNNNLRGNGVQGAQESGETGAAATSATSASSSRTGRTKVLLPLILLILTIITTVITGCLYEGVNPLKEPAGILKGVPFSAALIFILGTHELGHYFASRRHKVSATLPYFIPGPPIPPMIGTFGAVIKMKSAITNRRALIDIGASGPIVGFIASVIVTYVGLKYSLIIQDVKGEGTLTLGSSLIFKALSYLEFGTVPEGFDVLLHSVAFAGWIGFFITFLNLLPIGQLDGGHIVYAHFGPRHSYVSYAVVGLLVILGTIGWPGWLVWAALVTIIGLRHPPLADPYLGIGLVRQGVSVTALLVFVLTFMPSPFYIVT